MYKYFISEKIKIKNTFINKLVFIAPLMVVLLSGTLTGTYFQVDNYNWWYTFLLPETVVIVSCLLSRVDGKMKDKGTISLPVDLKKVWIAKILVGVKSISISTIIIFIAGEFWKNILNFNSVSNITMLESLIGTLVIIITSVWQIPIILFLENKIGMFLSILAGAILSILSVVMAIKPIWWINPFSYTSRLMCPILKILPNGLLAKPGSETFTKELLDLWTVPVGVIVSIILFIVLTYITSNWYEQKEAN